MVLWKGSCLAELSPREIPPLLSHWVSLRQERKVTAKPTLEARESSTCSCTQLHLHSECSGVEGLTY